MLSTLFAPFSPPKTRALPRHRRRRRGVARGGRGRGHGGRLRGARGEARRLGSGGSGHAGLRCLGGKETDGGI